MEKQNGEEISQSVLLVVSAAENINQGRVTDPVRGLWDSVGNGRQGGVLEV